MILLPINPGKNAKNVVEEAGLSCATFQNIEVIYNFSDEQLLRLAVHVHDRDNLMAAMKPYILSYNNRNTNMLQRDHLALWIPGQVA